jgi:CheY-like chemotaxis protein
LRQLAARLLRKAGFTVFEAESGEQALSIWKEQGPSIDLVFTDIIMPDGMNGWELARTLAMDRPDVKILCASGYAPAELGPDPGFPLLAKPYGGEELLATVRRALAHQETAPLST